ncbi:hypothetical protein HMPREF0183_1343 [Brevibacterium mcbrellneri ATCC 49030]|uniref:Uncharacterized protein n=1 Tax=Brevibacterium mcbrellneri ATCC 49030 TaxID=585530 RepID=D4YN34_9MICO|nr:hypothetical protein [Brevibacterium mcbrellneri]EFG47352.1 hypothetical protein HMPREF0183_1343 [Brevibacterium mcbrellneri ATCC 49030]
MFYAKGFYASLLMNAAVSVIAFVAAVILGPTLALNLGTGFTRLLFVALVLFWRFGLTRMTAERMWELDAPLRRILFNLVPAGMLGAVIPLIPFALIATLSSDSLALVELLIDALFVGAIITAASMVSKPQKEEVAQ